MVNKSKPEINRLMAQLREANGGMLDGSDSANRRACNTMLARMKRDFPTFDPEKSLSHLITVGKQDKFHGPNLTSFQYLIYNATKIVNNARAAKHSTKQQQPDEYAHSAAEALARKLATRQG